MKKNIWVFEIITILANLSGLMLVMLGITEHDNTEINTD